MDDGRAGDDLGAGDAGACCDGECDGCDPGAGVQNGLAGAGVGALGVDAVAGGGGVDGEGDFGKPLVCGDCCPFVTNDGVGAGGERGAGGDFGGLAGCDIDVGLGAGGDFPDDAEADAGNDIGGVEGVAVHCDTVEGRLIAVGEDGLSEGCSEREAEFTGSAGEGSRDGGENATQGVFIGRERGHWGTVSGWAAPKQAWRGECWV